MKRLTAFATAIVIMGMLVTTTVSAQGSWSTGIDIQNLTSSSGTVVIDFYDSTGYRIGTLTRTISGWGGINVYLPSENLSNGQFSAVISSDVQVAAVASQANYDLGGADMYLGTAQPETTLSFPLVYRNHTAGKWNSKLIIQNASDTAQEVTLYLFSVGKTSPDVTDTATIQPYSYVVFDISDSKYAAFGPYGSAIVTGTRPLAGVSQAIRNPGTGKANVIETEYRAFRAGQEGRQVVAPLIYKNYNLWTTGINIANRGGVTTTVTITCTNANPGISGGPWTFQQEIGPNAMFSFYTPSYAQIPDGFYGSAEIYSSDANIAVVVASQRYRPSGAEGVAYEGSLPADATPCVSLPIVHNRTTWKTGINILNLGDAEAAVTINYYSTAPGIPNATQTITISAHSPKTVYMPTESPTAVGFYGAADVKSTNGQPLLINVANSRADKGVGSNYVGINYICP
jgi:hypothetical protein